MSAQPIKPIILHLLQQGRLDVEAFVQGLTEADRTAIGTLARWSAKDHLAHRAFWHQDLISKLTGRPATDQPSPDSEPNEDQLNDMVVEKNKRRPWSEVQAEAAQSDTELIRLVEQLSEEDLTVVRRFPWQSEEWPLYTAFLGSCYEHDQEHLAQYYLDHDDLPRAIEIRERCANRILESDLPARVKGAFLYNLTCFYTQLNQLAKAATLLKEALTLAPDFEDWSQRDPDLAPLRDQST